MPRFCPAAIGHDALERRRAQFGELRIVKVAAQHACTGIRCAVRQPPMAIAMAVYAVFGSVYSMQGKLLEPQRGAERGHADAGFSCIGRDKSGDAVGGAGVNGASRMDAEMLGDVWLDVADDFSRSKHGGQQV